MKLISILCVIALTLYLLLDSKDNNPKPSQSSENSTPTVATENLYVIPSTPPDIVRSNLPSSTPKSLDLATKMTALIDKALYEEGGKALSSAYLERLTAELISSKAKAPFESALVGLRRHGSVEVPSSDILWTLSVTSMRAVAGLMRAQSNWLKSLPMAASDSWFFSTRKDIGINSLNMPPEAIAMGLTHQSWSQIIKDYPALNHSLGNVREDMLLGYAAYQEELWLIQNAIYRASLELDIEIIKPGSRIRQLAAYYPPLHEIFEGLDNLQLQYRDDIAGELVAVGLEVTLP